MQFYCTFFIIRLAAICNKFNPNRTPPFSGRIQAKMLFKLTREFKVRTVEKDFNNKNDSFGKDKNFKRDALLCQCKENIQR